MSSRDRTLQVAIAALIVLHLVAALAFPGSLWGVSQLAAWPAALGVGWTALALLALVLLPRWRGSLRLRFPGLRGSLLLALAGLLLGALLHERSHFFGDGALLVRDRGHSESVTRALLLVRATSAWVAGLDRFEVASERSLALLAILAGGAAAFLASRLAAVFSREPGGRFVTCTLLLLGGGCTQLFCGHVEYYALFAAALLAYLLLASLGLTGRIPLWPTWIACGVLATLHLASVALVPAQLWLGYAGWRQGERWRTLLGMGGGALVLVVLARQAGGGAGELAGTALAGLQRYVAPYAATASARHPFPFYSGAHALAVANDLLLVAPLALAALPALGARTLWRNADPLARFLALGAAGAFGFSAIFARELGPYRDWDILAPFGFLYLAWTAARWVRPKVGPERAALAVFLVGGVHHLAPWVALQLSPGATIRHLRIVLRAESQWSPHARAYLYEEMAIWARERGDLAGAGADYRAAIAANPADARYHTGLGVVLVQAGDLQGAAAAFAIAVERRPHYAPALNNLAYVLAMLGRDLEAARAHAEEALRLQPGNPDYLLTLARVHLERGDRPASETALAAALASRPDLPAARVLLDSLAGSPAGSPALGRPRTAGRPAEIPPPPPPSRR